MPQPTVAKIRARFAPWIFDRGLAYYNDGHVLNVTQGGNTLSGQVQGSQPLPYAVVVQLGSEGQPQFWRCSCAAAAGGDACKHIVALLLAAAHMAQVAPEPKAAQAAQALLAEVGDEQLRQVMADLLRTEPAFADAFVRSVARQRSPGTAGPVSPTLFDAMIESAQRELRFRFGELHDLEDRLSADEPDYDDYGYYENQPEPPSFPADILDNQIAFVETLLGTNEADLALDLLIAVLEEWGSGVQDLPEVVTETFTDDLAETTSALVHVLAGALLWPGVSAEARADCAEVIDMWREELPEVELAARAATCGWDHPPLVAVLEGKPPHGPIWGDVPDWVEASLATLYLAQLERQERGEEYLRLAKAAGRGDLYAYRLAHLGRIDQVVAEAPQVLHSPGEFMHLGRLLVAQGEVRQGLHTAALGLASEDKRGRLELALWLRFEAASAGETELALKAALLVFMENCSLDSYRAVERLAGEGWPELKPELLAHLAQSGRPDLQSKIYVAERMVPDAIAVAERSPHYVDMAAILELAAATQPDWCIQQCQRQADAVIQRGSSGHYADALPWLRRAQAIYREQGRADEWQAYITRLIEANRRKYTLTPLLRELG